MPGAPSSEPCYHRLRQELLDPDIWEFIVKYNLDDRVMNRLIETLNKRRGKSKETLEAKSDETEISFCEIKEHKDQTRVSFCVRH